MAELSKNGVQVLTFLTEIEEDNEKYIYVFGTGVLTAA